MKHVFRSLAVIIVLGGIFVGSYYKYTDGFTLADKLPERTLILEKMEKESVIDFEITDMEGRDFKLSDFKGKVIILNFWASWCDPCIEEFPSMLKLIDKFKGDIIMVALSADYEEKDVTQFLNIFKAKSPYLKVAWDKGKRVGSIYHLMAMPETFIIGKDFKLDRKIIGAEDWATEDAVEYFKHLIAR